MNIKRELEDGNMGIVAPGSVEQFFPVYVPPPVRNLSCFCLKNNHHDKNQEKSILFPLIPQRRLQWAATNSSGRGSCGFLCCTYFHNTPKPEKLPEMRFQIRIWLIMHWVSYSAILLFCFPKRARKRLSAILTPKYVAGRSRLLRRSTPARKWGIAFFSDISL